ncbi:hypothetical protein [Xanthobacter sp.]|uniref:hypothetical protein n=1 Tax=Xanthobacter sp. TaxID=35809 RepID=UPI0025E785E9|nr:hypothetical protein [Xanthobacter sp.]
MGDVPTKPLDQYPLVSPEERPPVPPEQPGEPAAAAPAAAQEKPAEPRPAAALVFQERATKVVTLSFPFTWEGRLVSAVTVRRLITAEVATLTAGGTPPDAFEAYAAMTGLPATVLRGMDADDGLAVTEAAFDFLPRLLRDVLSG